MKSLRKDDRGLMFDLLVGAGLAIILFFAVMNIGTFINSTIGQTMVDSYPAAASRSDIQNKSIRSLTNLSNDYDDVLDALSVAAIVMAITLPLAAVVSIRKFF